MSIAYYVREHHKLKTNPYNSLQLWFYLGPMSSICSVVVFICDTLDILGPFVILCHVLQYPRSYLGAICPFGAILKLQGMVTNSAAEVILVN